MARMYQGKIGYFSEEKGDIGREYFTVTVENDGTRTIRCVCEMDLVGLIRDVTYTIDVNYRAMDCFVRVTNERKFVGSGWFRFTDSFAEGEVFTAADGRVSQKLETQGRVPLFGTHPIAIDILKCAHVKAANPGVPQPIEGCMNSSAVLNGASGPLLAPKRYDLTYRGLEKITVPAGTFACEHFDWPTGNGRTLNLFTTRGDWLPVRTVVPEGKRYYNLVEFREIRP
jgi:hypothetical protein